MPTRNEIAATATRAEAMAQGVLSADSAASHITSNTRKLFGFQRKMFPQGMPTEPKVYVFSISEYGDFADLGPGFRRYKVNACDPGEPYSEPCIIDPVNFFEEAKVDVTEHTYLSGQQIAEAILKIGPGMGSQVDKRRLGWFMSMHNPPLPTEVAAANALYDRECLRLYNEANAFAAAGKLNEINEMHRLAKRRLKQTADWDKPPIKLVDCIGCGETIKPNTVVHAVPYCGAVQPGKWAEALALGMKKIEDCPQEIYDSILADQEKAKKESKQKA